ncbi:hypothetical protein IJT93_06595 [bacterium]|nr:hypothetical protein [bacterium]
MLKRSVNFLLAALIILFVSAAVKADTPNAAREAYLQDYTNARYGFTISIPRHMAKEKDPENGDGFSFYNGKTGMEIKVYGAYNALNENIGQIVNKMQPQGSKIIHKFGDENVAGKSDFIVECKDANSYYVYRAILLDNNERIIRVFIKYPLSQVKECGPDARGVTQSLIIK